MDGNEKLKTCSSSIFHKKSSILEKKHIFHTKKHLRSIFLTASILHNNQNKESLGFRRIYWSGFGIRRELGRNFLNLAIYKIFLLKRAMFYIFEYLV
ncbi:hypothetical protein [Methanosarcina sp. UBA5]|uniref:hypothetical protein n=1 Tax=Methanosarcina sp. UBA5 TaxID=1915593 RepID=UPI0025FB8AB6|nr:hypothetical protein [Methanosarcina sp. UBA5]